MTIAKKCKFSHTVFLFSHNFQNEHIPFSKSIAHSENPFELLTYFRSQDFRGFCDQDVEDSKGRFDKFESNNAIGTEPLEQEIIIDVHNIVSMTHNDAQTDQFDSQLPCYPLAVASEVEVVVEMDAAIESQGIPVNIDVINTDVEKRTIVKDILDEVVENITVLDETEPVGDVSNALNGMNITETPGLVGNCITYCRSCCSQGRKLTSA